MGKLLVFLFISFEIFSLSLISANGQSSLLVNTEPFFIKNISFDPLDINIDYLELGFYKGNNLYKLKDYKVEVDYIPNSNIIKVEAIVENYIYKGKIYSSMLNKELIFIRSTLESINGHPMENIRFFAYIKESNPYGRIASYDNYYSYDNFYFKGKDNKANLFLTNDIDLKKFKLSSFVSGEKKSDEFAMFLISNELGSESKLEEFLVIGSQNNNLVLNLLSLDDEVEYWNNYFKELKDQEAGNLIALIKSYQRRDGSIYNFYDRPKYIKLQDMIYSTMVFLEYGYLEDARRSLRYILNSNVGVEGTNIISNYAYDFNRKEVFYSDNYGQMLNLINPSMFLTILRDYYFKTGDRDFIQSNWPLISRGIGEYLLSFVSENGVRKNSGNNRRGKEGLEQFVESQYWVYKALEAYMHLMNIFNLDINPVLEAMDNIKKYMLNYLRDDKILDYPNSESSNEKNIYYFHIDFIDNELKYEYLLIKNLFYIDRYRDRSSLEQLIYIDALYNFNFIDEGAKLRNSFINRTRRANNNIRYEFQKSLELTSRYLLLLRKGQQNGYSL